MEQKSQYIEKQSFYEKLLAFPAFYTLQDHIPTRKQQLTYWAEITHRYFKQNKILQSSLSELNSEAFKLFQDNSTGIPKRLNREEIISILDDMARLSSIEWKGNAKENFSVNWTSPFELADAIYQWAKDNKLMGYTETLDGISNGEQTDAKLKFYELPKEQILKACQILEETQRADVYEDEGNYSVKFK